MTTLMYDPPKINQSLFEERYVELLLNMDSAEKRAAWLEISTSPLLPVLVVDDETKETIFRVPPLSYGTQTQTNNKIAGVVQTSHLISEAQSSVAAGKFLAGQLNDVMVPIEPPQEDVDAWKYLINRYKHGHVTADTTKEAVEQFDDSGSDGW